MAELLDSFIRAFQLKAFLDNLAAQKELRAEEQADRAAARQFEDVMTRLRLEDFGAQQVKEGPFSDLFRAGTRDRLAQTRAGEFVLPTPEQRQQRSLDITHAQERAKQEGQTEIATIPPVEGITPGGPMRVDIGRAPDVLARYAELLNTKKNLEIIRLNQGPDALIVAVDKSTGEIVQRTVIEGAANPGSIRTRSFKDDATGDLVFAVTDNEGNTTVKREKGVFTPKPEAAAPKITRERRAQLTIRAERQVLEQLRKENPQGVERSEWRAEFDRVKSAGGDDQAAERSANRTGPRYERDLKKHPEFELRKTQVLDEMLSQESGETKGKAAGGAKPKPGSAKVTAGAQVARRVISKAAYDARVAQFGKERVDAELKRLGITVE